MAKTVFCFICKKPVEVKDDRAIAKLCPEHDTEQNRNDMVATPIKQLLSIQNEGLQLMFKESNDATKLDIDTVMKVLNELKAKVDGLPQEETKDSPTSLNDGEVNEFGEII